MESDLKNRGRLIPVILITLGAACFAAGVVLFFQEHPGILSVKQDNPSEVTVSVSTAETVVSVSSVPEPEPVEDIEPSPDILPDDISGNLIAGAGNYEISIRAVENPYKDYFLQNSDMAGWLSIPDTTIDYPVMWTPENEDYYLYKGFDKKWSGDGCPILDTDSSMNPLTTNLIIHGHNNKGRMFNILLKYADKEYMDQHPNIYLYAEDCEHIYQVMAVFRSKVFYTTDTCFKYYKFFNAFSEEEFNDFYDNVKEMSLYDTGVTAQFGDHFLTLSTCSAHTENGRFVVVAKEIEHGDIYLPFAKEQENDN